MKSIHHRKAFTLIELMVAIAASAILLLLVATILIMALRSWNMNNAYVRLRRDAAFATEIMARDIRESTKDDLDPLPTAATLTLTDSSGIKGYSAVFTENLTNGILSYTRGANISRLISEGLQDFHPSPHQTNGVTIGVNLRLEMADNRFDIAITNETFVLFRNE